MECKSTSKNVFYIKVALTCHIRGVGISTVYELLFCSLIRIIIFSFYYNN